MDKGQPSVLVVDDEPGNLRAFVRYFRNDLVITSASSGTDALARVRGNRGPAFDLIVVDQSMPDMTGVDVLTILADESPEIGRLICTGYPDHPHVAAARRAGIIEVVIMKPWSGPDVLRALRGLVRDRAASDSQSVPLAADKP